MENKRRSKRHQQLRINQSLKRQLAGDKKFCNCCYCGIELPIQLLTLEHKLGRYLGGDNSIENAALACRPCNQAKGAKDFELKRKINKNG